MKISLKELYAGIRSGIDFDYTIDLSKEEVNFELPFQKPVRLYGSITDMAGVMVLRADIDADAVGHCARCGKPINYHKNVNVEFILSQEDDGISNEGDGVFAVGDEVELDDILVPELILNMEIVTLCSPDCKGLCYKCGADLNNGECACNRSEKNNAFADLARLWNEKNK